MSVRILKGDQADAPWVRGKSNLKDVPYGITSHLEVLRIVFMRQQKFTFTQYFIFLVS